MKILLKTKYLATTALIACVVLESCNSREVYYQFEDIKSTLWSKTDSLGFVIDTNSVVPGIPYDIQVETVNNSKFPYQNLWLFIRSNISGEKVFDQDTLQIKLADAYGNWLGSGFGSYYQTSSPFKARIIFPQKRNYKFRIIQGMRLS